MKYIKNNFPFGSWAFGIACGQLNVLLFTKGIFREPSQVTKASASAWRKSARAYKLTDEEKRGYKFQTVTSDLGSRRRHLFFFEPSATPRGYSFRPGWCPYRSVSL